MSNRDLPFGANLVSFCSDYNVAASLVQIVKAYLNPDCMELVKIGGTRFIPEMFQQGPFICQSHQSCGDVNKKPLI